MTTSSATPVAGMQLIADSVFVLKTAAYSLHDLVRHARTLFELELGTSRNSLTAGRFTVYYGDELREMIVATFNCHITTTGTAVFVFREIGVGELDNPYLGTRFVALRTIRGSHVIEVLGVFETPEPVGAEGAMADILALAHRR